MLFLTLACACSEQAVADGSPPFPDGRPSDHSEEPADDLGALAEPESIVEVDRVALEDPDAPSPLELLDADEPTGELVVVVDDPSPPLDVPADIMEASGLTAAEVAAVQVIVRAAASEVAARRPPGMGVPWYERYADEVALVLLALIGMMVRRLDLSRIDGRMGIMGASTAEHYPEPIPTPSVDIEAITRLSVDRERLSAENARLSAAVEAHTAEIARLKAASVERLAGQSSVGEEIEASREAARRWMLE